MLEQLFNNHLLYSLSLTLVHFLWQGLLVGFILKSALLVIDKSKSKLRYGLATLSMLTNLVLAVITFMVIYSDNGAIVSSSLNPIPLNSLVQELTQESNAFTYQELASSILVYSLPYLSIFWLATIIILAGKLLVEVRNVNNLSHYGTVSPTDELLSRFEVLAKQIKLSKVPRLLISLNVDVPMAIGWIKPVVLLPATMVTGLDSAQLEMLLLHELAHIRRHDYLVNFLQTLIELLFFFHPCVHWVGKQMRNEREYCSDDVAVQHCGDAIAYAHTLTDTATICAKKHCHTIPTMAMAASGGDLKARVVRLVDHHCAPTNDTSKWLAALTLLLVFALTGINQLVSTSFAYHLTGHFPWYEGEKVSSKTKSLANIAYPVDENTASLIINNSIAQQLLNDNESNGIEQSTTSLLANNISTELTQNQAPLSVKNSEDHASEDNASKVTDTPTENIETDISLALNANETMPADNDINKNDRAVEVHKQENNLIVKQETNKLTSQLTPNDTTAPNKVKGLTTESKQHVIAAQVNTAKPAHTEAIIAEQVTPANVTTVEVAKTSPSLAFNTLAITSNIVVNNSSFASNRTQLKEAKSSEQSYSQAIDEFELQNDRYNASFALTANTTPVPNKNEGHLPTTAQADPMTSISAKLLNPTSPVYPSLAKRRGVEMKVKVNFTVGKNGKVKDISFGKQQNTIYFKSAIRMAIRKWRFTPATINNDIVESKMSKIFSFSLQS